MDVTSLKGKTALVTGAASGIGLETAALMAERGADLVICDLDESGLAAASKRFEASGSQVFARRVDVADEEQISVREPGGRPKRQHLARFTIRIERTEPAAEQNLAPVREERGRPPHTRRVADLAGRHVERARAIEDRTASSP